MKKIDIHLHLTFEQLPKKEGIFLSSAEHMIPHLKSLGIEKGIVLASGESDSGLGITTSECRKIAEHFPHTYGWMCNVDDRDLESIYERLELYKQQGAVGIGELMINRSMEDPIIQRIFQSAEKLGLPVLFHMSPKVGYEYGIVDEPRLPLLEKNLKRYPNLIFIGHSQPFWHEISKSSSSSTDERMEWGKGPVIKGGRVVELFETYPNLYGDLSANSGGCAIMRDEQFGLQFLEAFYDRLFFGTDMVNTDMEFPLGKWLDKMVEEGKLSTNAYECICFKNAQRVFGL